MDYKKEKIKDHEEYSIDTNGIVYSKRGNPMKTSLNPRGYEIVTFCENGVPHAFSVHRLVGIQFIENKEKEKLQINHKDGVKNNNNVDNLEWCTKSENMKHRAWVLSVGIEDKNINARAIIGTSIKDKNNVLYFNSIIQAARFIKTNTKNDRRKQNSIWEALNGENKSAYGYFWKYDLRLFP